MNLKPIKMNRYLSLIVLAFISINCFSQSEIQEGNTLPKSTFIIQIDDKEYILAEGDQMELETADGPSILSVKLAGYKLFDNGSIAFQYPSNFGYEFEESIGYKNWTLDGNDVTIMIFEIAFDAGLDFMIEEMVGQFGKEKCTVEETELKLGAELLKGKRINVTLVGQYLTLDFFEIIMADGIARYLSFQDSLEDDGSSTIEMKESTTMIDKTIKYNKQ